jgi:uncharacterized protein YlxW (UPF0749 family)
MEQELKEAFTDLKNDFTEKHNDLKQDVKSIDDKVDKLQKKMAFHEGKHSEMDKTLDGIKKSSTVRGSTGGGVSGIITSIIVNLVNHFLFRRDG